MYESYFGLSRRPFSATPDASCFLPAETTQTAFDKLLLGVERGMGIGILTAAPGTGKTLLCQRLAANSEESFHVVLLANANFPNVASLLPVTLALVSIVIGTSRHGPPKE